MLKIFTRLESFLGDYPFFQDAEEGGKTLGIIITSNKGLCGGYNVNVMKKVNEYVQENEKEDIEYVAIGKKAAAFIARTVNSIKQIPIAREFLPIEGDQIKEYLTKVAGEHFDVQKELATVAEGHDYDVEPSMEDIAFQLIPMVLDLMFYDILLEAKASEHSARMVAMKAAKDNSKKIADDLTLAYNKARQAMITKEVSEIVGWVESLKEV